MIHEVNGCDPFDSSECLFLQRDKYDNPYCGHPSSGGFDLYEQEKDADGGWRIKTPDSCPLKTEEITIKLQP